MSDNIFDTIMSLDVLAGVTSIFCLAAISLERMTAVKFPSVHINLTSLPVLIALVTTWLLGITLSQSKHAVNMKDMGSIRGYTLAIFTLGYVLPLTIVIGSYCLIFHTATNMIMANEDVKTRRELRLAKTISLVVGLFVVCWTPFFVVNMVYVFCKGCFCEGCNRPQWPIHLAKVRNVFILHVCLRPWVPWIQAMN